MKIPALVALFAAQVLTAAAQKAATGEAPGPWILGTIGVGRNPDGAIKTTEATEGSGSGGEGRVALKGLAIKVGEHGEAAVAYDLDLCRMVGAWTGKFTTPMNLMSRGEYKGFYAAGRAGILRWEVSGTSVLEMPELVIQNDVSFLRRHFEIGATEVPFKIVLRTDLRDLGGIGGQSEPATADARATAPARIW